MLHCNINLDVNCAAHYKKAQSNSLSVSRLELGESAQARPKGNNMANTLEDFQKFSKAQFDSAASTSSSFVKGLQTIAAETTDYSKKSLENGSVFFEKLLGVKSLEAAIQLQSEYVKTAYADFVAQATKIGELYSSLIKEAFKPIELAMAKAQGKD